MSDNSQNDRRTDPESTPIRRRAFLAASGLLGATTIPGLGAADALGSSGEAPRSDPGRQTSFTRYELAENGLGNAQTDTPPFCPRLTTYDGRQYYAYWTHAGKLVVAARDLPDGEWSQHHTDVEIGVRDGHWTPALGIGPDGHVFVCYNTRGSRPTWRRSTRPADVSAFGPERNGMTGQNEDGANYPEFARLNDGTLLFGYRQGGSGNGDWMLNRWNSDAGTWEPLHHPLILGEYAGETYNAYPWNLVQSNDGVLHYFFCWRGTGGVQTNQQLSYARSPDGGETWTRSDGTPYELPITKGAVEVVDPIEPDSNLINQGWSAYHPETDEPHVAYYRDDAEGHTQIFHASLSDGDWEIEAATDRQTNINLGGGGVVASPIGRMGIVVGDDGDVHIVTRDFQRGSWPLLVEKRDGEWETSILYKRNMTWSDLHIDPERWRQDRVLSFVDHQQTVGDVPWSADALVGISDVDPDDLGRATRTVESWGANGELTTYASTGSIETPITTSSTTFEDTSTALAATETTVPATPMYARATADVEAEEDAESEVRVKIDGRHGTTYGEPAAGHDGERVVTEWTEIPQAFRAGFANVQVRSSRGDEWSDYSFESQFTVESEQVGFIFRARDADNFYMWQVADESHGFEQHLLRPHVRENGSWTLLDEIPLGDVVDSVEGQEHEIRIEAIGSEITTFLDSQEIDRRTDDTHTEGRIGFRQPRHSSRSRSVLVDAITVTDDSGEILFETAFESSESPYFDAGDLVGGHLRLDNTGITLIHLPAPTTTLTDVTLELGYDDPTSFERTVAPQGSSGADTKPLAHMVTVNATGLQEEAPVRNETSSFRDSSTSLDVERATPATPLYGRVTARMEPTGSLTLDGSSWIWYPDDDPAWDYNDPSAEGVRYFRRSFQLDEVPTNATLVFTADNLATASINGTEVGTSADGFDGLPRYSWQHAAAIDVSDALQAGENVLAMKAERFGNYAGLIGRLYLSFGDETRAIDTDGAWVASQDEAAGWRSTGFDDSSWPAAQVLGDYGMGPWGTRVSIDGDPAAIRMKLSADGETAYTDPVQSRNQGVRTTGWKPIPPSFNGGSVTLQSTNARVTAATLELAIRNDI